MTDKHTVAEYVEVLRHGKQTLDISDTEWIRYDIGFARWKLTTWEDGKAPTAKTISHTDAEAHIRTFLESNGILEAI